MKKYILLTILFLFACTTYAQETDRAALDRLFTILESQEQFMGGVSVYRGGEEIYFRAAGYANLEDETPVTPDTRYRIGSVSKMFTASIIMQLIGEGALQPETTLSEFFPGLPNAERITILQMLQHRSGIFNITGAPDFLDWRTEPRSRQVILDRIASLGTVFEPGERQEYSNSNYVLLCFIAEELDGASFPEILENRITGPLGLSQTSIGEEEHLAELADSYNRRGEWIRAEKTHYSIPMGAGAIVSTPRDMNRFADALFAGRVVADSSLRMMQEYRERYGIGLVGPEIEGVEFSGHSGGIDGYRAILYHAAEEDLTVAVTSNAAQISLNDLLPLVVRIILGRSYELPVFESQYMHSTEELEAMAGTYGVSSSDYTLTMQVDGEELVVVGLFDEPSVLAAVEKNRFTYGMSGFTFEFVPGQNELLITQGGETHTFRKQ